MLPYMPVLVKTVSSSFKSHFQQKPAAQHVQLCCVIERSPFAIMQLTNHPVKLNRDAHGFAQLLGFLSCDSIRILELVY